METYNKIRFAQYFAIFLVASIFYLISSSNKKINFEVEKRNIQADKEYLDWLVNADESNLSSNLKSLLKDQEKISFLSKESQLPFSRKIDQEDVAVKVNKLLESFITKYDVKNLSLVDQNALKNIIQKVVAPEFIFLLSQDETLDMLLNRLALIVTPVGTTLQDWLIRFLTSDSLIIAIPMIEKIEINNKPYQYLGNEDKEKVLLKISNIINNQFHDNLIAVQKVFNFEFDSNVFEVIKNRMFQFLKAKFIL